MMVVENEVCNYSVIFLLPDSLALLILPDTIYSMLSIRVYVLYEGL